MDDDYVFQANLTHAKEGYANAQDVIKFIDSKSTVLTGILVISTGIPFAILQIPLSSSTMSYSALWLWFTGCGLLLQISACASLLFLVVGVVFGGLSLLSSTNGLRARRPRNRLARERGLPSELCRFLLWRDRRDSHPHSPPLTVLFPQYPSSRTKEAQALFKKLGTFTPKEILEEYAVQLESVGSVLEAKVSANKNAFRWFELQVVAYALSTIIGGLLLAVCLLTSSSSTLKPNSAPPVPALKP